MVNIMNVAKCIVENLANCGFDDVTDSSGYYVIKEFEDGTDRAVDVYKSTDGGNPHYVIYCSYEDDESDYRYTEDLSVEQLWQQLKELCVSEKELAIANLIYDDLCYMYCDNCRFNSEISEEESNKKFGYWGCEDCHRKYNGWGISKAVAESLAKEIVKICNN